MNFKKILPILGFYYLLLSFSACKNDSSLPITPPTVIVLPEMKYLNNTLELIVGQGGVSPKPILVSVAPFSFSLTVSPITNGFLIDKEGIITIPANLPENIYKISVTMKDTQGSKTFVDIFTVLIRSVTSTKLPPENLKYVPNNLKMVAETTATSVVPTISSFTSVSYMIDTNSTVNGIVINPSTGMISIASTVKAGNYSLSIIASNSFGSKVFQNIFLIEVKSVTTKIVFDADIAPIFQRNGCNGCHNTTYSGTKDRLNSVLDRIQRQESQAGFMPQGGRRLSDAEINLIKKWVSDGLLEK